jgi:hypothetical protein
MADNRREFIRRSGVLLGAVTLAPVSVAVSAPVASRSIPEVPVQVVDFLKRAGASSLLLRGGSALSTSNPHVSVNLVAVATDPVRVFKSVLADMPFQNGFASGNVLSFIREDVFFSVECVSRAGLRELKTRLSEPEGIFFAHEALLQPLEGGAAFDPHGLLAPSGRTLRMVTKSELPVGRKVAALITGLIDGVLYRLQPVASFSQFHDVLLAGKPVDNVEAKAVADEITAGITQLALYARSSSMERLLTSPLVSTSLERIFGRTGTQVVWSVKAQAASVEQPGAPWLLGILGPEKLRIRQGAAWIQDSDRYSFMQTKSALDAARTIANTLQ